MSIKFSSLVIVIMVLFAAKLSFDNVSSAQAKDQVSTSELRR